MPQRRLPTPGGCPAPPGMECFPDTTRRASFDVTDAALFIGWGATAAGRERKAVELFGESLRFLTNLVTSGEVASVEPFFLEPHGGDLEGFFLVRGGREELNRIR